MKTTPLNALVLAFLFNASASYAQSCSPLDNVKITFFGYPDNSPPGPGTAFSCGPRGLTAGGTGTYSDPITIATATDGDFKECEIVYMPYLRKYFRYEDDCAQCKSDWDSNKEYHIDIWTGSNTVNGGDNQVSCENNLPGGSQTILRGPANNLPVDTAPLYSSGNCNGKTYPIGDASSLCSGSGGPPSSPLPTTMQTTTKVTSNAPGPTCAWDGHCQGAPCSTDNDCSDPWPCINGVCG